MKECNLPNKKSDDVRIAHINDYPLSYTDSGNGAPIVLIHGSLNDYRSWMNQVAVFSRSHRVLAVSLRHYFPETWDGLGDDFSLTHHAADMVSFIRSLGLESVHLVGHSRGGAVAYLVARDAPELVRSLVLAEPRGLEDLLASDAIEPEGDHSNAGIFATLHANLRAGDKARAAEAFVDAFNGAGSWAAMPSLQKTIIIDNIPTAIDSGELPGMRCEDIAAFTFPVLLVRGENSLPRYAKGLEAMRRCNPAIGEVAVIPDAPHGMHRANPEAFNAAVLKFLSDPG